MRTADNRVRTLIDLYGSSLADRYGAGEVRAIVRSIFQERLGWDMAQLELRKADFLSESELVKVYGPLARLRAGEPLQYVLGQVSFHGLELEVAPAVLIPRPETEELVQRILEEGVQPKGILDIGTGSGCIALALQKNYPNAAVYGLDVSEDALRIAARNAKRNLLMVHWSCADVLDPNMPLMPDIDLVVSNPPYVPRSEEASLSVQVREHEPHMALFVPDDDPLLFYRAIATKAMALLPAHGRIRLEGHYRHAGRVGAMLRSIGFQNVRVLQDLSSNDRFIFAER